MLFFRGGAPFATGRLNYDDGQPETAADARIMIQLQIAGQPVRAMVDTGAPYVILDPELALDLGLQPAAALETTRMRLGYFRYSGALHRLDIELPADDGQGLSVQATVFVPQLLPGDEWRDKPNFIGLSLLDRIRYAIDPPPSSAFFFGPLV